MPYQDADRRVALLELELAREQTDGIYCEIEAALVRKALADVLDIGMRVAAAFDASVQDMADDLNGHEDG